MGPALAAALWLAALACVLGLVHRGAIYLRAGGKPIPLTPAPRTRLGVVARVLLELLVFRSLFRADKTAWVLGSVFHWALALVALRHLWLFTDPPWAGASWLFALGPWPAVALAASSVGLLIRRVVNERVRYVSAPSDYLWPVLLLALAGTGLGLAYGLGGDIAALRHFALGLVELEARPLPAGPVAVVHLLLAAVLVGVLPFSKLLHGPGVLVSPTFVERDARRYPGARGG